MVKIGHSGVTLVLCLFHLTEISIRRNGNLRLLSIDEICVCVNFQGIILCLVYQ